MEINQQVIGKLFLSSPGDDLVLKLLQQFAKIPAFITLFGPYDVNTENKRWADYQRFDWSIRQLPAICVFESGDENKESDQAFLNGSLQILVFWPPNFRRPDTRRVESSFKGVMENFFSSDYVTKMLDELYYISRPEKVYGLNELGRTLTWSPDTEGIIDNEQVPVTNLTIPYKIDLRSWYRALEFMGRTKENPFEITLNDLSLLAGGYQGVDEELTVHVEIPENIQVQNP